MPPVLIDSVQFESTLLNLIVNCGDAMKASGSITIETSLVEIPEKIIESLPAGKYVKLSVRDNGEGIPPDLLNRVVEPFFTTKPIGKGTGLGLSQAYGFMAQSKGGMKIESEIGAGTTVSLYLPALDDGDIKTAPKRRSDKALVVDDQPEVLDMAAELFRTLGYDVLAANNGIEALAILDRHQDIGLLFSDIVMPGMSGIELGNEARKLNPHIKVILASGYAAQLSDSEADISSFALIAKLYRISDIVQHLRS